MITSTVLLARRVGEKRWGVLNVLDMAVSSADGKEALRATAAKLRDGWMRPLTDHEFRIVDEAPVTQCDSVVNKDWVLGIA